MKWLFVVTVGVTLGLMLHNAMGRFIISLANKYDHIDQEKAA